MPSALKITRRLFMPLLKSQTNKVKVVKLEYYIDKTVNQIKSYNYAFVRASFYNSLRTCSAESH